MGRGHRGRCVVPGRWRRWRRRGAFLLGRGLVRGRPVVPGALGGRVTRLLRRALLPVRVPPLVGAGWLAVGLQRGCGRFRTALGRIRCAVGVLDRRPARRAHQRHRDDAEHRRGQQPHPQVDGRVGLDPGREQREPEERHPQQPAGPLRPPPHRRAGQQDDGQQRQQRETDQRRQVVPVGEGVTGRVEQRLVDVLTAPEVLVLWADPAVLLLHRLVLAGRQPGGVPTEDRAEHAGDPRGEHPRHEQHQHTADAEQRVQRGTVVAVAGELPHECGDHGRAHREQGEEHARHRGRPRPVPGAETRLEELVGEREQ